MDPELVCSARRCRAPAVWALRWNNPAIHETDYRKTWLACDEHVDRLTEFLDLRGFALQRVPVGELDSLEAD